MDAKESIKKGCFFHGLNSNSKLFYHTFFIPAQLCLFVFFGISKWQHIYMQNIYKSLFINHRANHINSRWSDKRPSTILFCFFSLYIFISDGKIVAIILCCVGCSLWMLKYIYIYKNIYHGGKNTTTSAAL